MGIGQRIIDIYGTLAILLTAGLLESHAANGYISCGSGIKTIIFCALVGTRGYTDQGEDRRRAFASPHGIRET